MDTVKFDRLFIWQLEENPQSAAVLEGLLGIVEKLGKRAIAEGVENLKQIEYLDRFRCRLRQGFYYAQTVPEKMLPSILGATLEEGRAALEH